MKFIAFWSGFKNTKKLFKKIIPDKNIIIASHFPIFYEKLVYRKSDIFYSGEARKPWVSGSIILNESLIENPKFKRNIYFPNWILTTNLLCSVYTDEMVRYGDLIDLNANNLNFEVENQNRGKKVACVFGYINNQRELAINMLRAKGFQVDIFGACNAAITNKQILKGRYDYMLVMENTIKPGYVTEKLIESFHLGLIPIYWGNASESSGIAANAFISVEKLELYSSSELNKNSDKVVESQLFLDGYIEKLRTSIITGLNI